MWEPLVWIADQIFMIHGAIWRSFLMKAKQVRAPKLVLIYVIHFVYGMRCACGFTWAYLGHCRYLSESILLDNPTSLERSKLIGIRFSFCEPADLVFLFFTFSHAS